MRILVILVLIGLSPIGLAADITLGFTSNYLFNGITQTQDLPAVSVGIDQQTESGFYVGAWSSNVDFGGDSSLELDLYGGYGWQADEDLWLDVGVISYRYFDGLDQAVFDYTELSFAATYQEQYNYKLACSWDYSSNNEEIEHCFAAFTYNMGALIDDIELDIVVDYSHSFDIANTPWGSKRGYFHTGLFFSKSFDQLTLTYSLENIWFNNTLQNRDLQSVLSLSYSL